ncbi:ABC-ATPase domain-containing protein [Corynebacterium pyruviciproducens]|uniref:ABC-ATPase domain-containing protein n=1 Tax=Corynebacterium pyruviciproducens TaxID=598660 RepID=UPI002458E173|nr:ABC-ATPase domain-containing protein [Corynebacterium pyruviciproducens]MDH4658844.1 ABC-ATPase domain-containing protein [Corynebacterium pyruviciproducens]
MADLFERLSRLDGKGYGAYKSLSGCHELHMDRGAAGGERAGKHGNGPLSLVIDHVQADPYAPPSKMHVELPNPFPQLSTIPVCDQLARRVAEAFSGNRDLVIDAPGQEVLPTAACVEREGTLHLRFAVHLPARGRRIMGRRAAHLICDDLPAALEEALAGFDPTAAAELFDHQEGIRRHLGDYVAFVADGAILPRLSGTSPLPLKGATPFAAPETLQADICGVTGMGVPAGVTVIVGGGFHGKSTLLNALSLGVYNHRAGDGREFAITNPTALHIRAADGRAVTDVDISEFISDLPTGADTARFSTANASGSTSQAASLMEAVEAGAKVLLIDEDTSATNFMIRDSRMRQLITAEPITPLVDRVRALWRDLGVSTVIVAGGSSAFLDVADTVIAMEDYLPRDVTREAKELAEPAPEQPPFTPPAPRRVERLAVDYGKRRKSPQAKGRATIRHGRGDVDISAVEQVVSASQAAGIARAIGWVEEHADGRTPLAELSRAAAAAVLRGTRHPGAVVQPRALEIACAVNRYRGLTIAE